MSKLFGFLVLTVMIQCSTTQDANTLKTKLTEAFKSCSSTLKSQSDAADIKSMKPTPIVKEFFNCCGKFMNFVNAQGAPIESNIRDMLTAMKLDQTKIETIMKSCVKTSPTPTESSYDMMMCVKKMAS